MDQTDDIDQFPYLFLPRPEGQLRNIPVNFRWEVTRRHPIYLQYWQSAQKFYQWRRRNTRMVAKSELVELQISETSAQFLRVIGVTSFAPDPSVEFSEIGIGLGENGWLRGSISPVTLRGIWGMLVSLLPPEVFSETAIRLANAMTVGGDSDERRSAGLMALQQVDESQIDQLLAEPIVNINPAVSNRQIIEDLNRLLDRLRAERNIEVGRDRSESYPDYLRVWDLREGWSGGSYQSANEKTLAEVAKELDIKPSTASARYRSAFQLITGHEYSPTMWLRFMGIEKLSRITQQTIGRVALRRPTKLRANRDIPSSTLGEGVAVESIANKQQEFQSQMGMQIVDLVLDIESLVRDKKSNTEIFRELEVEPPESDPVIELIEMVRSRN